MERYIKLCKGKKVVNLPREQWERNLSEIKLNGDPRTKFMTKNHCIVRNFLVKELPKVGLPIAPKRISSSLNMTITMVRTVLEDLEKGNIFVIKDDNGSINWAFPVTVEPTSHHLAFSTGEMLYGA